MSSSYIASNWRLLNQENSNKSDNYGLSFDGTEFIDIGVVNEVNSATACTLSYWGKKTASNKYLLFGSQITSKNGIWLVWWSDGNVYFSPRNGANSFASYALSFDTNWHHFVGVYDGSSAKIYIDGNLVSTSTTSIPASLSANAGNDFNIGYLSLGSLYTDGEISEVAVFDYALSESQISTLYGSSSLGAGNPMALKPQPVAYYPLGDNSASNPLTQPNEAVEDASVFDFDGSQYINVGDSDLLSFGDGTNDSPFSISAWINFTDVTSTGIFSKSYTSSNREYIFHIASNDKIFFNLYSLGTQNNYLSKRVETLMTQYENEWTHVVATYNGSKDIDGLKIYINKVRSDDAETVGGSYTAMTNTIADPFIGRSLSNYAQGNMSNVAVFDKELTQENIDAIYNNGTPLTTAIATDNLKAWYKLDQSANWEADSSGAWQIPDAVSAYPQSFDFDGTSDYITLPTITLADDWSVSVWMRHPVGKTRAQCVGESTGVGFWAYGGIIRSGGSTAGKLSYYNGSSIIAISNERLDDGNWHHWIITYNNSTTTLKCFVDGEENYNDTYDAGTGNTINRISNTFASNHWKGELSNIAIWNSDQSSEALNIYNSGVPAISYTNTPVAWYKLDNTATWTGSAYSIPDASGNGNTGTSSGMTEQNLVNNNVSVLNGESSGMTSANLVLSDLTRAVPYDSYSFNFDSASGDYIQTTSNSLFNGLTAFSVSCWIKRNGTQQAYACILTYQTSTSEYLKLFFSGTGSSDKIEMQVRPGSTNPVKVISSAGSIPDGEWVHIAVVGDANNLSNLNLYINGVLDNDVTSGNITTLAQSSDIYIGTDAGAATTREFNGKISNISVFNEALTSTEVLKLYANGVPQDLANFTPQPVAWYTLGSNSFWNGSNWICRDLIGSNDGTSANAGADAIVGDAPRSEANGTGTNMDIPTNLEGSTKWSNNNSWSINMSSTARVEDTP